MYKHPAALLGQADLIGLTSGQTPHAYLRYDALLQMKRLLGSRSFAISNCILCIAVRVDVHLVQLLRPRQKVLHTHTAGSSTAQSPVA